MIGCIATADIGGIEEAGLMDSHMAFNIFRQMGTFENPSHATTFRATELDTTVPLRKRSRAAVLPMTEVGHCVIGYS